MKNLFSILVAILVLQPPPALAISGEALVKAALERTLHHVTYDGSYHVIQYPGGDVPATSGVCTDVIIRSYRKLNIDLQKRVHLDMKNHFSKYPSKRIWGLNRPDPNIDHRRVPNLQVFFSRHGEIIEETLKKPMIQEISNREIS